MRKIPGTMATQHPDNALPPYWDPEKRPFISAYQEVTEAMTCYKDLGVSEYMWDWEGKHADAAVIDRLFSDYYDYFSKQQLGRDKFLTFRIPNIWEEKGYSLLQAMSVILSSEDVARDLKFQQRPLFEVILPMTERADQLTRMQELFDKLSHFKSKEFTIEHEDNTDHIELIPLVETFESQLKVGELLTDYVSLHEKQFGNKPEYIRAFLACSDSSLTSGLLAGIIGNKIALARLNEFADKSGIPVFPIAGSGSLVFRGGLSPARIDRFITEFPGLRTATVQSSFRYDHPQDVVKEAIAKLEDQLAKNQPRVIDADRQEKLVEIAQQAAKHYKDTLNDVIPDMQEVIKSVPRRRDRRQHTGLMGYSRTTGQRIMPRAITFTAAFYSIGVPPEIISMGRTLRQLSVKDLEMLREEYPNLQADIELVGRYLNSENLAKLAGQNDSWKLVQEDVAGIEETLGIKLGPRSEDEKQHYQLSNQLLGDEDNTSRTDHINQMAVLRKSLG